MSSRTAKIARMVAVQRQLHRLAEWKLVQLQRREADLHGQESSLIGSLNAEEPLHGLFVPAMAKRLASIGKESAVVAHARQSQSDIVLAECRKLKQAERMGHAAASSRERDDEKRRLEETIDQTIMRARDRAGRNGHEI
jgi:hypothetical protein